MQITHRDLKIITKNLLHLYGIRAKKRLSQHFIVDSRLLDEILERITKLKPSRVVEVGTGLGVLTASLSNVVKHVVTIELDSRLANIARDFLSKEVGNGVVDILVGDGIPLLRSGLRGFDVIVSNVPYSITGLLINSIIKSTCRAAVLTLQNEVAERLTAPPGSKGYSRLTVMVNTFMEVELGNLYPPTSFTPRPKVHSRVVVLKRLKVWSDEWRAYEDLIRCLFNQRRKLAKKVLQGCLKGSIDSWRTSKINNLIEDRRVYQLNVETLLSIYLTLRQDLQLYQNFKE